MELLIWGHELPKTYANFVVSRNIFIGVFLELAPMGVGTPQEVRYCGQVALSKSLSCVQLCVTLWTVARQAPLSRDCSRQECWSG